MFNNVAIFYEYGDLLRVWLWSLRDTTVYHAGLVEGDGCDVRLSSSYLHVETGPYSLGLLPQSYLLLHRGKPRYPESLIG